MALRSLADSVHSPNMVWIRPSLDYVSEKSGVVLNFYLTENIPNNFLVPIVIESACKTFFMLIETLV